MSQILRGEQLKHNEESERKQAQFEQLKGQLDPSVLERIHNYAVTEHERQLKSLGRPSQPNAQRVADIEREKIIEIVFDIKRRSETTTLERAKIEAQTNSIKYCKKCAPGVCIRIPLFFSENLMPKHTHYNPTNTKELETIASIGMVILPISLDETDATPAELFEGVAYNG